MQRRFNLRIIALLALVLQGCTDRLDDAEDIAKPAGLERQELIVAPFRLTTFSRLKDVQSPVHVYIEGDGAAWASRYEPSLDPTPRRALALRLAALDRSPNVIYLARPCQFTRHDPSCTQIYWTDRRYSYEVIDSMDHAVSSLTAGLPHRQLELIGYSGGATIAALLAEKRDDITSLRTVAGNLTPQDLAKRRGVSPLQGSQDPSIEASRLSRLPQRHLVGGQDTVIPRFVAEAFIAKESPSACATIIDVPRATHEDGWTEMWEEELRYQPMCHK